MSLATLEDFLTDSLELNGEEIQGPKSDTDALKLQFSDRIPSKNGSGRESLLSPNLPVASEKIQNDIGKLFLPSKSVNQNENQ
jgi:hypothetical protein